MADLGGFTPVLAAAAVAAFMCAGSWLLTGPIRRFLSEGGAVAVPDSRSSHDRPTPAGGGLAFVVPVSVAWFVQGVLTGHVSLLVLAPAGLLLSWVGFEDDRRGLPPALRLAVQAVASATACTVLAPGLAEASGMPSWAAAAVAFTGILWSINLFNFMDGLDGLAASEGIFIALGGIAITLLGQGDPTLLVPLAALAGGLAGFFPWNAPRARIFMGDAGSTWLGFVLPCLALMGSAGRGESLAAWVLLPALFVADATVCLVRRLLRGENVVQAHRAHAYQNLSRQLGSHAKVLATFATGNACLIPVAWACLTVRGAAWPLVGATYAVLIAFAVAARSGVHGVADPDAASRIPGPR